jgi:hypothetical protein
LFGRPVDRCQEILRYIRLPGSLHRYAAERFVHVAMGSPEWYGLPKPDHHLFESHPIVNSLLPHYVAHGRIRVKPDVERLEDHHVRFVDGTSEPFDVIIYATGYQISFPFLDADLLQLRNGCPHLYLNIFPPNHDHLFVVGLIQPDGGLWRLADMQAQLVTRCIQASYRPVSTDWFRRRKQKTGGSHSATRRYIGSPRHLIEVNYFDYRDRVRRLIREFDRRAGQ